jgi:exodeoxyribonuclease VII small subunit
MAEEQLSFEEAFEQLEEIVRKLEAGGLPLEESLALFERGTELAKLCNKQLDEAELRVQQLLPTPQGDLEPAPFEDQDQEQEPGFRF